jgi:hypothetical protein
VAGRGRPHLHREPVSAPSASTERRFGEPSILWVQNAAAAIASHTLVPWWLLRKGDVDEAGCDTRTVSAVQRVREILQAIRSARFPSRPERRYDLIGEAMARPFGGSAGRGAVRAGRVTDDDNEAGSGES